MEILLTRVLAEYSATDESGGETLRGLQQLIERGSEASPTADTNFEGHVTGSIFVVALGRKVLLLEHKRLGKRLQPGGHVDATDLSPLEAALRELEEEAGIKRSQVTLHSRIAENADVPFHIEVQTIPASSTRGEPSHPHYDFQYLATVQDATDIMLDPTESDGFAWLDWAEFSNIPMFAQQAAKMALLLSQDEAS